MATQKTKRIMLVMKDLNQLNYKNKRGETAFELFDRLPFHSLDSPDKDWLDGERLIHC